MNGLKGILNMRETVSRMIVIRYLFYFGDVGVTSTNVENNANSIIGICWRYCDFSVNIMSTVCLGNGYREKYQSTKIFQAENRRNPSGMSNKKVLNAWGNKFKKEEDESTE